MIEQLQELLKEAKKASDEIRKCKDQIRLISHYDADGISSAAIMTKALIREGKSFHLTNVKQINEDLLKDLKEEKRKLIIFTDLGSGYLQDIKKYLSESLVIICDHHQPDTDDIPDSIIHISSIVYGIDENISGAGVAYLLARSMKVMVNSIFFCCSIITDR